jgi:LPS export ABC transporter permease LptG/LPS export ABC transporter permease LptF
MRILTRYVLREVTSYALIGAGVFTFLFFMVSLEKILELVVRNSAPLPSVLELFAYTLPQTLTITLPMGVLIGVLIGLSRLAADSEITAMRSSGMGSWNFVGITSWFVLAVCALSVVNNTVLVPRAAAARTRLDDRLKSSQVSYEIQPRVFYEDFPNYVLYVQDAAVTKGGALWKNILLADITSPSTPKITQAREGILLGEGSDRLQLHLVDGAQHESDPRQPDQYTILAFGETDIPLAITPAAQNPQAAAPVAETPTRNLLRAARRQKDPADAVAYRIEFHRRWSMAVACVVLALVGIPLGLSSKKGGKSTGFVLTIVLVFVYYIVALSGMSLARQGKLPVALGMWLSDGVFLVAGILMLYGIERLPVRRPALALRRWLRPAEPGEPEANGEAGDPSRAPAWRNVGSQIVRWPRERLRQTQAAARGALGGRPLMRFGRFPMVLDSLVIRDFLSYLLMLLSTFLVLLLVFTFFELLRDIVRNHVSLLLVGTYLINLVPYLVYNLIPLTVLLAVLVTFGLMQKSNEITAMKATGISVYRITAPVLVAAVLLAGGLFAFDQLYLPQANKRQDALRNQIKGKAAQTYLRPERKWIFGEGSTVYFYEFFDPDQNRFGAIQAFQFDPRTFAITRRIYAARAHWSETLGRWVFEQGWQRSFRGNAIQDYRTFDVATFPDLTESPAYFKKEVKQSSEMNYGELGRYIRELQQSGFDVVRLRVQLQKKLAFPLITFVMAVLAIPFSLRSGRRGAITGVATAIGIGVVYWIISGLFEAMGNTNQLPAIVAAWSPDLMFALAGGYLILKIPT